MGTTIRNLGVAALLGIAQVALAEVSEPDNQCVACHQVEELSISLGHSMSEWRASSHARSGIGCEKCHGGDPSAREAKAAHEGVLPSSDPASKVSTQNIAATCGSCHDQEWKAFKSTVHAKEITKEGDAATCLTCHGSMATSYPSPRELNSRCTVCHERPVEARSALSWLSAAKTQLLRTHRTLEDAKNVVPEWHEEAVKRFHEMEKHLLAISLQWHTFDMDASIKKSRDLLSLGKLLDEEAQLKIKMGKDAKDKKKD